MLKRKKLNYFKKEILKIWKPNVYLKAYRNTIAYLNRIMPAMSVWDPVSHFNPSSTT